MSVFVALVVGFLLDLALGDPARMPHIVVGAGKLIAWLEARLRRIFSAAPRGELVAGGVLVCAVLWVAVGGVEVVLDIAGRVHPLLRAAAECFVCYQVLATKCLRDAAERVRAALAAGDLAAARRAVSMIVGRDVAALDAAGVARAAVETVAENASDGVVAPMLFFALGGAPWAVAYKVVNTMDSMLGYKNSRYLYFGRCAARVDDVANFIPARLTAWLMVAAAAVCGFDWRGALRVYRRDRAAHSSPNSGHPEAACAGALGVRLGGDSVYGGRVVRKPVLGGEGREVAASDIHRANRLLYACAWLCFLLCLGIV